MSDFSHYCRTGRLKLREIRCESAQLIWYSRPDEPTAKDSHYILADVGGTAAVKQALTEAHGIWCVVVKRREIYLRHSVRIHLDDVAGLGTFIEFEAVLDGGSAADAGRMQVEWLAREFNLMPTALVDGSYSDLITRRHDQ